MLDSTKDLLNTVLRNDPSITQEQRREVVRVLEGKSAAAFSSAEPIYRVLPRKVVAELLSVSPRTVTAYAKRGLLMAVRNGVRGARSVGFTEKSVRDLMARAGYHG